MLLTRTERTKARALKRRLVVSARAKAVSRFLLAGLDATTTYSTPETPRTPRNTKWRAVYGSHFELVPDGLLDADGKPTGHKVVQKWSHQPGEIVESNGQARTGDPGRRYMVRPDHSLRAI